MITFSLRGTFYRTSYGKASIILNRFQILVKEYLITLIIMDIIIIKIASDKSFNLFQWVRILVASFVIFGEALMFCLKIPFLDIYQILTWHQV